jgi:hypothetical protein
MLNSKDIMSKLTRDQKRTKFNSFINFVYIDRLFSHFFRQLQYNKRKPHYWLLKKNGNWSKILFSGRLRLSLYVNIFLLAIVMLLILFFLCYCIKLIIIHETNGMPSTLQHHMTRAIENNKPPWLVHGRFFSFIFILPLTSMEFLKRSLYTL